MAIYIPITRIAQTEGAVVYRYTRDEWGADPEDPSRRVHVATHVGTASVDKSTGTILRLSGVEWDADDVCFSRVARVLARCHASGSYPAETSYSA